VTPLNLSGKGDLKPRSPAVCRDSGRRLRGRTVACLKDVTKREDVGATVTGDGMQVLTLDPLADRGRGNFRGPGGLRSGHGIWADPSALI